MKLHLSQHEGQYAITAYDADCVHINHQPYRHSLIVMPDHAPQAWPIQQIAQLQTQHLAALLALKPEIVLLGCGEQHQLIHPQLAAPLYQAQLALECMTTAAACRTYNILMAEGRRVLAALLLNPA